jgi:hypothetical protein
MIDEFEFFLEKPWSDGLPVVTPTEARLAPMLAAAGRLPEDVIGAVPPAMNVATGPTTCRSSSPRSTSCCSNRSISTASRAPCMASRR